jgi:hypothetical protein
MSSGGRRSKRAGRETRIIRTMEEAPRLLIGPLCGTLREFVLVVDRMAVLGARSAPRDAVKQPKGLREDIKGRTLLAV